MDYTKCAPDRLAVIEAVVDSLASAGFDTASRRTDERIEVMSGERSSLGSAGRVRPVTNRLLGLPPGPGR